MSKTSRRKRATRRLASKMGNYNAFGGQSPESNLKFTKPGSNKLKT